MRQGGSEKTSGKKMGREAGRTYLGICITKLDGDVTDKLVLKTDSHDSRDRLDHGRLAVSDMADSSYPRCIHISIVRRAGH